VVKLDSFVVASSRETNAMAIANNEQRFAPNVKLVVSADSFGDVMDGNVAEMMKFLPGVTALYDRSGDQTAAARISVRGFSAGMVAVSTDGAQLANTSNVTGNSRFFDFSQMSINNLARIEVTKVPTPGESGGLARRLDQHGQQERVRATRCVVQLQLRFHRQLAPAAVAPHGVPER
jgi:outer membrane receptor for ferrienterochelin and colicin